jgi:drug/metabolite transporter (DMT)-like permease
VRSTGTLFCLGSALAFGTMGVLGKLAFDEGATVGTLVSLRFVIAAALFWVIVPWAQVRALSRREVGFGLALGAVGYALQAALYFLGLDRLDAGLLVLIVYTFPAMVAGAAIVLGRERFAPRKAGALVLALTGLALVVGGAGAGVIDPLGAGFALACAVVYTAYVLVSSSVRTPAMPLALLVTTGAAVPLTLGSIAAGDFQPGALSLAGAAYVAAVAVIASVGAITLHLMGLKRVGPTTSSILATAEPLVAVVLAFAVFGDTMNAVQLLGAALVLGAIVLLNVNAPTREPVSKTA